tara:strand:- start:616 stop:837 length:222 start_codon:yes stop_codon:yes gene_type:complete
MPNPTHISLKGNMSNDQLIRAIRLAQSYLNAMPESHIDSFITEGIRGAKDALNEVSPIPTPRFAYYEREELST